MLTVCRCLASVRSAVWYRSTTQTDQTSSIASGFHCFFTSGINTRFCLFVGYTFSVLLCAAGSDIQACCQLLECTCCRPTPVMESLTTSGSKNSLMPIFLVSWSWSEVLVLFSVLKATILVLCLETGGLVLGLEGYHLGLVSWDRWSCSRSWKLPSWSCVLRPVVLFSVLKATILVLCLETGGLVLGLESYHLGLVSWDQYSVQTLFAVDTHDYIPSSSVCSLHRNVLTNTFHASWYEEAKKSA